MDIRKLLKQYNIKTKKSLGQHFLIDEAPLQAMLDAAELHSEANVLEIGPGLGVLTVKLCERAKKVVAVEKDRDLIPILEQTTCSFKNICIIEADVLKLDMEKVKNTYFDSEFNVVANLPYYITSPIIMKIIDNRHLINSAVIMVQKEVAERLTASPGTKDYGILSIAAQLYADISFVCNIKRTAFLPPPKVDSAVVKLSLLKKPRTNLEDESFFFEVVKAAFSERRKTLKNCLKSRFKISPAQIEQILAKADIDSARRGETLSIEEFTTLAQELKKTL